MHVSFIGIDSEDRNSKIQRGLDGRLLKVGGWMPQIQIRRLHLHQPFANRL